MGLIFMNLLKGDFMRKLDLNEIKEKELNLLLELDAICKANNICYTLAGGTLLGAIRHKGFIPWDDDIDICMPRGDYERFIHIMKIYNGNGFIQCDDTEKTGYPFVKFVDKSTRVVNNLEYDYVWLDVLPADGLPQDEVEVRKIYKKCKKYRDYWFFSFACEKEVATNCVKKIIKKIVKPFFKIFNRFYWARKLDNYVQKYKIKDCDYMGIVSWGLYGTGERIKKMDYYNFVQVEFEGHLFPAPGCWHEYLTGIYGDYMTLPPENKRVTHDIEAYQL